MSDLTPRRKTRIKTGFCIGRYNPKESEMSSEFEFRIYISHNLEIVFFFCQRSTTEQKVYTEQNPDDNICAPSRAIFVNLTQIYRFTRGESNIPGFCNVCVQPFMKAALLGPHYLFFSLCFYCLASSFVLECN